MWAFIGEQKDLFPLPGFEPRIDDTITRLRAGRSRKLAGLSAGVGNFSLLQNARTGSGAQTKAKFKFLPFRV